MEINVLDSDYTRLAIVDNYSSFIWTDRYSKYGDFELVTVPTDEMLDLLVHGRYLLYSESEHAMIIETVEIVTDVESGNTLKVTGRSLESILDRRIVWGQTTITGNFQDGIQTLLNNAIISPSIADRKIDNFQFRQNDDESITSLTVDAQYTGDVLYDVIQALCEEKKLGFKIVFDEEFNMIFSLYKGIDRSYNQTDLPFVVFSPNFENIISSNYLESIEPYKNVTLVAGEGEGSERRLLSVGEGSGLNRREMFTDARDISSKVDDRTLSPAEYNAQLKQRGEEKLAEAKKDKSFEGDMDVTRTFKVRRDFDMGDIVEVESEHGKQGSARVTELITSHDATGLNFYPTFESIEEDD